MIGRASACQGGGGGNGGRASLHWRALKIVWHDNRRCMRTKCKKLSKKSESPQLNQTCGDYRSK